MSSDPAIRKIAMSADGSSLQTYSQSLFIVIWWEGAMGVFGDHHHHFEADITILPLGPETRKTHPFNGIRWDFCYLEDLDERGWAPEISMIWPEFVDDTGNSIPTGVSLQGRLHALMHVVVPEMIERHRERLRVGTRFVCTEGPRPVAEGVVTSLSPMA
jgi:hypothetical protein